MRRSLVVVLLLTTATTSALNPESFSCAYKKATLKEDGVELYHLGIGEVISSISKDQEGGQIAESCQYCYALWVERGTDDEEGKRPPNVIVGQGCWSSPDGCRSDGSCIQTARRHEGPLLKLNLANVTTQHRPLSACCCRGAMCNENFTSESKRIDELATYLTKEKPISRDDLPMVMAIVTLILVLLVTIALTIVLWKTCRKMQDSYDPEADHKLSSEKLIPSSPSQGVVTKSIQNSHFKCYDLEDLQLGEVLGRGHFGIVYEGQCHNRPPIALKISKQGEKRSFFNERDIYETLEPYESSFILHFLGSHDSAFINGENHEHVLILELAANRSLSAYLKTKTVSWPQLCKMLMDISQGVSHLHSAFKGHDGLKPCICHRDLNSSNILVREDLSCCISDFSLATKIDGCNLCRDGLIQNVDNISLDNVGTIRYMAPELLDCALNMSYCEGSLKQVDIYAIGLVFWETSHRCRDLYQGVNVPAFEQCYEKEIGPSPTFEQMRILVSRNKARPLFPEVWKNSNPAIQQLKETIMDSWDHDGEARLTACCVVERIRELTVLWERYKLVSQGPPTLDFVLPNNTQPQTEINRLSRRPSEFCSNNVNAAAALTTKNDNIVSGQQPLVKIQPHQGLNPCLERNFISEESETKTTLVVGSVKDRPPPRPVPNPEPTPQSRSGNDRTNYVPPIAYVQNDIGMNNSHRRRDKNLQATNRSVAHVKFDASKANDGQQQS